MESNVNFFLKKKKKKDRIRKKHKSDCEKILQILSGLK